MQQIHGKEMTGRGSLTQVRRKLRKHQVVLAQPLCSAEDGKHNKIAKRWASTEPPESPPTQGLECGILKSLAGKLFSYSAHYVPSIPNWNFSRCFNAMMTIYKDARGMSLCFQYIRCKLNARAHRLTKSKAR